MVIGPITACNLGHGYERQSTVTGVMFLEDIGKVLGPGCFG